MKRKKFVAPKDFDLLELECDEHNLIQFQMLGKGLKRKEKDIERQKVALGRRVYLEKYGIHLNSIAHAKRTAEHYRGELND